MNIVWDVINKFNIVWDKCILYLYLNVVIRSFDLYIVIFLKILKEFGLDIGFFLNIVVLIIGLFWYK